MTLQAIVNGESRPLRLQREGDGIIAFWGDQRVHLNVSQISPGVYSVLAEGRGITVTLGDNGWAHAAGEVFQVEVSDPRDAPAGRGAGRRSGQLQVAAPMAGKVVRVLVQKGDTVAAGQGLLVVEAMKMQNEMKALRDAKVVDVFAQASATVAAGEVLLILE
jgi:biotin carboxyl carrier protein